jgi:hypothetical protein
MRSAVFSLKACGLEKERTMPALRLNIGDRVQARTSIRGAPAGAVGTIRRVFATKADLYDVQFDDQSDLCVVERSNLECIEDEPEQAQSVGEAE